MDYGVESNISPSGHAILLLLSEIGFLPVTHVERRASIADLFRPHNRCGLYVLHFSDGWYYAGQAIDVVRRYAEHRHTHSDIRWLSFRRVARDRLNLEERELIEVLERKGAPLRNISLVSTPPMPSGSDFDLIMSRLDQERWLNGETVDSRFGVRVLNPELRVRYQPRFERLLTTRYADHVIPVLREYVQSAVPAILDGEISFWTCSCLPSNSSKSVTIYSRINIYWQEVFTAGAESSGPPFYTLHLARSVLEHAFGENAKRLSHRYPFAVASRHRYQPGGQDQISIEVSGSRNAQMIIHDPHVARAAREFNLRLARKGPCTFSRYHCLELADRLVEEFENTV